MYEKDGEKYFVVDGHIHYWDASPENWVPGAEQYAKGWIECFHAYMGLAPPIPTGRWRSSRSYSEDGPDARRLRGRPRRRRHLPADLPERVVHERLQHHRALRRPGREAPRQVHVNTRWDPREGDAGLKTLEENVAALGLHRGEALHGGVAGGSRGWTLRDPEAFRFLERCQELGVRNIHSTRARRSGRSTRTPSTSTTSTPPPRCSPT